MARRRWVVPGLIGLAAAAGLVFAVPAGPRNFHVVTDGVLYRSGQLNPTTFEQVLRERNIRTVVSLRTVRDRNSDAWEEEACRARGVRHVRIPPQDGPDPLAPVARAFLEVMDDPANRPVLVHCLAGRDRTGAVCAVYRIEFDGWAPDRALAEMGIGGFDPEKDAAAGAYADFVRTYRPRQKPVR